MDHSPYGIFPTKTIFPVDGLSGIPVHERQRGLEDWFFFPAGKPVRSTHGAKETKGSECIEESLVILTVQSSTSRTRQKGD